MLKNKKIIFFGTTEFSTEVLNYLINLSNVDVVLVVTQPDRKSGRNLKINFSAIKNLCLQKNINFLQPEHNLHILDQILIYKHDILIVCAYGQLIHDTILNLSITLNIHPSLLPKWRGPSPIHYSILYGDKETGVTFAKLNNHMDTGDIYYQQKILILITDTKLILEKKLIILTKNMLDDVLLLIMNNQINAIKQEESQATYSKLITKDILLINWQASAVCIFNKIRAFADDYVSFCQFNNINFKIFKTALVNNDYQQYPKIVVSGQILQFCPEGILVTCNIGTLLIIEWQKENFKKIATRKYFNNIPRFLKNNHD